MRHLSLTPMHDELAFGEAPRWHQGRLWLSDIGAHRILSLPDDGAPKVEHAVDFEPSGLGWLPDGTLLVVSMDDHRVMRHAGGGRFETLADVSQYCGGKLNDMVVDAAGRAYVGNIGFPLDEEPMRPRPTVVVRVDPDGSARAVAGDIMCPNGMAITAEGGTLVVGQSGSTEVLGYAIDEHGDLGPRTVYAELPADAGCDGMCLDAEGAVWAASPMTHEFVRVLPGGRVTDRIDTGDRHAIACMLGGWDGRTLYAITASTIDVDEARRRRDGRLAATRVDVPRAGRP